MLVQVEFSSSVVESFVDSRADYEAAMTMEDRFAANPDSLVWLATDEGQTLFSQNTLQAIDSAAAEIRLLPYVKQVSCLTDLQVPGQGTTASRGTAARLVLNAQLRQGAVPSDALSRVAADRSLGRLLRRAAAESRELDPEQLRLLRDQLLEDDLLADHTISSSGTAHVILVELVSAAELSPAMQIQINRHLRGIVAAHGLGSVATHLSGLVPMQGFAFEQINLVLKTLLPLGGLLISVAVMLVFKRPEVIVFTLLLAAIANCWGIALGIAFYGKFSVLMAAVPLMVLVISTADVIHLLSSYTAERSAGFEHAVALRKMFREVGGACVLTSLTTFVGFASLVMVPSNTIRQFGFSAAAGVACALLLSVICLPLFLHWLHLRGRPITASASASHLTSRVAEVCLSVALKWPRTIVMLFLSMLAACGIACAGLTLDPDMARRFPEGHPVSQSSTFFNNEFGGVNSIELVLEAPRDTLLSPQTFRALQEFQRRCEQQLGTSNFASLANVVSPLLKELDYKNQEGLPESAVHAEAVLELVQAANPAAIAALITTSREATRVLVQVRETSYIRLLEVSEQVEAIAADVFGDDIQVTQKGSAPLVGAAVREIIRGHIQGFGVCFTTIVILIIVGLRSVQLGWISVLPNLTPLLVLGGLVSLQYTRVDSDILAVATLGLGLSVDDTIHFMSRFRIELTSGKDLVGALRSTMVHTGVAIIRTTLILSVGFLPFAFSDYWSINMLGTYLIAVLFAALFADLVFLPALLRLVYRVR